MKFAPFYCAIALVSLAATTAYVAQPAPVEVRQPLPTGPELAKLVRQRLNLGMPDEKVTALHFVRDLQALELLPDVIVAIEDGTPLPRNDNTGPYFAGQLAADVVAEIAQKQDGLTLHQRGQNAFSFSKDASEGSQALRERGRVAEVQRNWVKWWHTRPTVTDGDLTQDATGNFVLYVSNQSFDINPVDVTVHIDGRKAIHNEFDVKGLRTPQHNWIKHVFRLTPGKHTLKAVSQNGNATREAEFEIHDKHWAVIDYWFYPDNKGGTGPTPKSLNFRIQDQPIGFQ